MIARWKERTGRSPPDCLYSKTCRRARSPPFSVGCSQCRVLPGFLPHAATGNVSINLSLSQDPFAPFRRVPRSNLAFPPPLHPLPCSSSFGLFALLLPLLLLSSSLPSLVFPSTSRAWEKRLQTVNFRFPARSLLQTASIRSETPKLFRQ